MGNNVNLKREKILDAALNLVLSVGFEQMSTAAVHRAARVSRTTLYRHFPTRKALIEGVITHISDVTERRLQALIATRPDPKERIDIVIDLAMELYEQNIGQRLLKVGPGFVMEVLNRILQRNIDIFNAALSDVYEQASELQGAPVNAELIGNVMQRILVTLTLLQSPPLPGDLRQVIQAIFRTLLFDARLSELKPESAKADTEVGDASISPLAAHVRRKEAVAGDPPRAARRRAYPASAKESRS